MLPILERLILWQKLDFITSIAYLLLLYIYCLCQFAPATRTELTKEARDTESNLLIALASIKKSKPSIKVNN